ncbi:MAG: helix-turn-helix domain-containing protein [Hyphomonadaceae bacterium]|nr:helix-turn-helix domain-containing protein [Hyphomonadaceae bacterium]
MSEEQSPRPQSMGTDALIKLQILQLLHQGVKQTHIAAMLGVSDATLSRMIPKGLGAAIRKERNNG